MNAHLAFQITMSILSLIINTLQFIRRNTYQTHTILFTVCIFRLKFITIDKIITIKSRYHMWFYAKNKTFSYTNTKHILCIQYFTWWYWIRLKHIFLSLFLSQTIPYQTYKITNFAVEKYAFVSVYRICWTNK